MLFFGGAGVHTWLKPSRLYKCLGALTTLQFRNTMVFIIRYSRWLAQNLESSFTSVSYLFGLGFIFFYFLSFRTFSFSSFVSSLYSPLYIIIFFHNFYLNFSFLLFNSYSFCLFSSPLLSFSFISCLFSSSSPSCESEAAEKMENPSDILLLCKFERCQCCVSIQGLYHIRGTKCLVRKRRDKGKKGERDRKKEGDSKRILGIS